MMSDHQADPAERRLIISYLKSINDTDRGI